MQSVFKYEVELRGDQIIEIRSNNILSVKEQHGKIVIWAIVDTEIKPIKYEFKMLGTGMTIDFPIDLFTFLDTISTENGYLVFHIFYRRYEE